MTRRLLFLSALLLATSLVLQACVTRGGGRGGRGGSGGDDDDSSSTDDDDAANDDDAADDDDASADPELAVAAEGFFRTEFDFSPALTEDFGWPDCLQTVFVGQVSGTIEPGAPGDVVMRLDSTKVFTDCESSTGITEDPVTGVQFSPASDGTLWFWNYNDLAWDVFIDAGSTGNGSYDGETPWEEREFDPGEGTVYTYEVRVSADLTWD